MKLNTLDKKKRMINMHSMKQNQSKKKLNASTKPVSIKHHSIVKSILQPKLKIGAANDKYEQEADRIADQVMRMSILVQSSPINSSSTSNISNVQRKCAGCAKEDELIQKKASGATPEVTPSINSNIQSLQGGGQPLSQSERSFFEPRFRTDFSHVRLHTDSYAASTAQSINAKAFTYGNNVVFNTGEYSASSTGGRKLLAHELTHVAQQNKNKPFTQIQCQIDNDCSVKMPQLCPSYEQWIFAFSRLSTFLSEDGISLSQGGSPQGFNVLGSIAASRNSTAAIEDLPPELINPVLGDQFIDHPTNNWVQENMPQNLLITAYQLPSDCADIVVVLRHVYLSAHNRTEVYPGVDNSGNNRNWIVGDQSGRAAQNRINRIRREVGTVNLARVINPYSDTQSNSIRDFSRLEPLLHPGDQLVWDHHANGLNRYRTGGHSQTIMDIERDNAGRINELHLLQGNQPLFLQNAQDVITQTNNELTESGRRPLSQTRQNLLLSRNGPIRSAPGRRIEVGIIHRNQMTDISVRKRGGTQMQQVWTLGDSDNTILKVAGPPRSATRPSLQRVRGRRPQRQVSDWFRSLDSASQTRLFGVFEAALLEVRALIDGRQAVESQTATNLGRHAGNRLWNLARNNVRRSAPHLTNFDQLHRIRSLIRSLGAIQPTIYHGNPQAAQGVRTIFTRIDSEFNFAARGGDTINFSRSLPQERELVKILVTGFDPFNTNNISLPPRSGEWNPSGTAVLSLDGITIPLDRGDKVAVEGVVFPVSFTQFNQGIVERMVQQAGLDVNGVITVSLDPNMIDTAPVRIEQFAVGVRDFVQLQPHRLFPIEPVVDTGIQVVPGGNPTIIESNANVENIAQNTAGRINSNQLNVEQPTIGRDITLLFTNIEIASKALKALGLNNEVNNNQVTINDQTAIQKIINNMQHLNNHQSSTADIWFNLDGQLFRATLIEGPGGNFLSNEVSFRTQRELLNQNSSAISFHVHTPEGIQIPQDQSTAQARREQQKALSSARTTTNILIATLRRMIKATAEQVLIQKRRLNSTKKTDQ